MDVFGHVGLTLAAAYPAEQLIRWCPGVNRQPQATATSGEPPDDAPRSSWLDYRMVIVGSLIPDLIDKPFGLFVASDLVNSASRSIAHGIVFALLLIGLSTLTFQRTRLHGLLDLAGAAAGHLFLDQMWRQPEIALWPFLGWSFPAGTADLTEWSSSHLRDLMAFYTDVPEFVGVAVILLFALRLWRTRAVVPFLRTGTVA